MHITIPGFLVFILPQCSHLVSEKPPKLKVGERAKVGDRAGISKYKRAVFDKCYTPNFAEEIFAVRAVVYTNFITYALKDLIGEPISGVPLSAAIAKGDLFVACVCTLWAKVRLVFLGDIALNTLGFSLYKLTRFLTPTLIFELAHYFLPFIGKYL